MGTPHGFTVGPRIWQIAAFGNFEVLLSNVLVPGSHGVLSAPGCIVHLLSGWALAALLAKCKLRGLLQRNTIVSLQRAHYPSWSLQTLQGRLASLT